MSGKDVRSEVVKKALSDSAFKAELLKNPNAAVEKALGIKVPAGVTIKVVEDTSSSVHLVLPKAAAKGELGEGELEKVSGGWGGIFTQPGYCDNSNYRPCGG